MVLLVDKASNSCGILSEGSEVFQRYRVMASLPTSKATQENLALAVQAVQEKKMSYRKAGAFYGVSKSTIFDHATGKVEFGKKPGPPSTLTAAEEQKIVEYAIEMGRIGYGLTRERVLEMVKKIIDKDGRPNPFKNNYPGRKWWRLFLQRHPEVSLRIPEALQLSRARCCTFESLRSWYVEFEQFLLVNGIKDQPLLIWNADEAGFPLCPKSEKVLALRNSKNVYGTCGDTKEQITTLCAANASGSVLAPMHIFPGVRFRYNPMNDCVPGAYFGRSPNGWISTELFFGWIANHFAPNVKERPVLLLVDGHTCHIDLEISKFCHENGILLYCLPPHSSHITQPLDVGFFKPLKQSWAKACDSFRLENVGVPITKQVFASLFRRAWEATIKTSILINAFCGAGICPCDFDAIDKTKFTPSAPYSLESERPVVKKVIKEMEHLEYLENTMNPETLSSFKRRFEEGYDITSKDELYNIWSQLKSLTISANACSSTTSLIPSDQHVPFFESQADNISPALSEIITYPQPHIKEKDKRSQSQMPKHLSGEQMIKYLNEKELKKRKEVEEKEKRKMERELKRKEREEQREKKLLEKKNKSTRRGRGRGQARGQRSERGLSAQRRKVFQSDSDISEFDDANEGGEKQKKSTRLRGRGRGQSRCQGRGQVLSTQTREVIQSDSNASENLESEENVFCSKCEGDSDGKWIYCDDCCRWFHVECVGLLNCSNISEMEWNCTSCDSN